MIKRPPGKRLMIMDACSLIDFIKADRGLLPLISNMVGSLHVASPVIEEVQDIENEGELVSLGITVIEPDIQDGYEAERLRGQTSFKDNISYLVAKRHGLTCVTNDKNLRKLCTKNKVPVLWGMELVTGLHDAGGMTAQDAIDHVKVLRTLSPFYVTKDIVNQFIDIIRKQEE